MVSTSPLRTVTLWPTACDTSVSAALAPASRAKRNTSRAMPSSTRVETGNAFSSSALLAINGSVACVVTFNDMVIGWLVPG